MLRAHAQALCPRCFVCVCKSFASQTAKCRRRRCRGCVATCARNTLPRGVGRNGKHLLVGLVGCTMRQYVHIYTQHIHSYRDVALACALCAVYANARATRIFSPVDVYMSLHQYTSVCIRVRARCCFIFMLILNLYKFQIVLTCLLAVVAADRYALTEEQQSVRTLYPLTHYYILYA